MTFTQTDKLKALAIVHLFETSRPFGNYAACAVLNDGAGVSYGINQFTHRSGSLLDVVGRYLKNGGTLGASVMISRLPTLRNTSRAAIIALSADTQFKSALRSAAVTREMKTAQIESAYDLYLKPAIAICVKYGFVEPLSLAVVYDSVVHGSFYRVARTVNVGYSDERAWVAAYVRRRDEWLLSYTRLAKTRYRTRFFLDQLAKSNWTLRLPLKVHGVTLTAVGETGREGVREMGREGDAETARGSDAGIGVSAKTVEVVKQAAAGFDEVEGVVSAVTSRADAAKSMWTTVGGTAWQAVWAVFGFFAGLPREVWITVAVIAAILMLAYLYRQIELGRIREKAAG